MLLPLPSSDGKPKKRTLNLPDLKQILNYSRHWMKAKGRHGTHSPFVYAFVERVLRNKNKIRTTQVQALAGWPATWTLRERKLLYKTLYFLKPAQVVLPGDGTLDWLGALLPGIVPAVAVTHTGQPDPVANGGPCLLISSAAHITPDRLDAALEAGTGVLALHPHHHLCLQSKWEALYTDSRVKMSLDYWYFGLLLNDEAFKHKQHFRLR